MELSVLDRLVLLNVIPREGDLTTLKIVRRLNDDLSFSEDEHKVLNFHNEGEVLKWNEIPNKEVAIGEKATDVIEKAFKKLNQQGKLHMDYLDLYERFVKE